MNSTLEIGGITVNTTDEPIHCEGLEQEVMDAITALNNARGTSESADPAFLRLVSLNNRGVIFPTRFMFLVDTTSLNRIPSLEAITAQPGVREVYDRMAANWKSLNTSRNARTFARRVLINLCLSTDCKNLLHMSPEVFAAIMNSWKLQDGRFIKEIFNSESYVPVVNNIARSLAHHNSSASYLQATKQPRGYSSIRRPDGADFILANPNDGNSSWIELFNEWLHGQSLKNTKNQKQAFVTLLDWVKTYPVEVGRDPRVFLTQPRTFPSLMDFLKGANEALPTVAAIAATYIYRFSQWIIDSYMRDIDADGEVTIGINPLSYSDQQTIQGAWDTGGKPSETTSRPLPTAWRLKAQKILTEDNHAWPKTLSNQYFDWVDPDTGLKEKVWVPTLTCLFETMLELPLRRIQVLCLDSGEGDERIYDPSTGAWAENDGPAAGYWKKDPTAKVKRRGVIKDFSKPDKRLVGFYINTNKTADKNAPSGEKAGYAIPWQNDAVIRLFTDLRHWQERYNPQTIPTPYVAVSSPVFGYSATETAIKETPDRFYLFRTPCGSNHPLLPPTYMQCFTFWNELMAELERRLQAEGEDVKIVEKWNKTTGQPQQTAFNIHGLRVATLTAFAEAGVPIEVLSKIVAGHSSILMTIYYLKFNEASISQLLCDKALEIKGNAADELKRHLENESWERAKKIAVYNNEECFRSVIGNRFSPAWSNEGYGLCPHAGTRCEDGGPEVKGGKYAIYGAVPGGKHNCLRCRHFISGTPFLIQMWMKTNKLLVDSQKIAVEYDGFVAELKELEDKKYRLAKAGRVAEVSPQMKARIKELEAVCDLRGNTLNETLLDLHAAWRLTESIRALISEENGTDGNLPALLSSAGTDFEFGYREGTRFETISYILQASRLFPVLQDDNLELERERFLDTILLRENLMPLCLMPLSGAEKRKAADAAALFLLTKVGAEEVQSVYEGKVTLKDLGFSGGLALAMANAAPALICTVEQGLKGGNYING